MSTSYIGASLRGLLLAISRGEQTTPDHINEMCSRFMKDFLGSEAEQVARFEDEEQDFRVRCYSRWKSGLDLLRVFRNFCVQVGRQFQEEFCRYEDYRQDPLLGVLMRQHANACRVAGEVEALLRSGYPDGALARWRTLHEIAVSTILLRKFGKSAVEDFIHFGLVEAVSGMVAYQETANEMGRIPLSRHELDAAKRLRDEIIESKPYLKGRSGWAGPHVGASRFEKLQAAAGLAKWKNDYKWASQNVHTNYRQMQSLLGMSEAKEQGLLVGPSDSAFTDPAQFSAIALAQTTSAFVTCYIDEDDCRIDFTFVCVALQAIDRLVAEVGKRFLWSETA